MNYDHNKTIMDAISKIYWHGLIEEEYKYAEWYKRDSKSFISFLKKFGIPKEILVIMYKRYVRDGLMPIEDLSQEEKRKLVSEAGECENIIGVCKSLHVIKSISK